MVLGYWRVDSLRPGPRFGAAPKRHVEFVVNIGAPQLAGGSRANETKLYSSCWITAQRDRPLFLAATGANLVYGIRFRDFALPAWLSGDRLRDTEWSTDLGLTTVTASLVGELSEGPDLAIAAAAFDRFLLSHPASDLHGSRLRAAVAECERAGAVTPAAILGRLDGPSHRLRGRTRAAAGVTLRRFARLARFDRALHCLQCDEGPRIADVAHAVGYYDEAHMAHDFAALAGVSPATYRRVRREHERLDLPHHLFVC